MKKNTLSEKIKEGLTQNYTLLEFRNILVQFKEVGGSKEKAISVLENLRLTEISHEDTLLEILDIAWGWCRVDLKVF